jgi:hypothetical protein
MSVKTMQLRSAGTSLFPFLNVKGEFTNFEVANSLPLPPIQTKELRCSIRAIAAVLALASIIDSSQGSVNTGRHYVLLYSSAKLLFGFSPFRLTRHLMERWQSRLRPAEPLVFRETIFVDGMRRENFVHVLGKRECVCTSEKGDGGFCAYYKR